MIEENVVSAGAPSIHLQKIHTLSAKRAEPQLRPAIWMEGDKTIVEQVIDY